MISVRSLPNMPPVGTRCFYRNEAIRLEGKRRAMRALRMEEE